MKLLAKQRQKVQINSNKANKTSNNSNSNSNQPENPDDLVKREKNNIIVFTIEYSVFLTILMICCCGSWMLVDRFLFYKFFLRLVFIFNKFGVFYRINT